MTFSPREQVDILKAWLALTLMFVFVVHRGFTFNPQIIGKYFFVIGLGFVLHELAHKLVAQRYGFWAEFRSDDRLLMMSLAMAYLTGFFFAAPGAVWWHGPASQRSGHDLPGRPCDQHCYCLYVSGGDKPCRNSSPSPAQSIKAKFPNKCLPSFL